MGEVKFKVRPYVVTQLPNDLLEKGAYNLSRWAGKYVSTQHYEVSVRDLLESLIERGWRIEMPDDK